MTITILIVASAIELAYAGQAYSPKDTKNYIPPQAFDHRETIKSELDRLWSSIPEYNYIPSLIEHESCISLQHSRCWNSTSELKSTREQGLGLGQVTRTFNPDGSIRFDSLKGMRDMYMSELKDASWSTIKGRPDLQIRMMILHLRTDYSRLYEFDDPLVRLHATDAAYNGGRGAVNYNRRACGLAKGCNPQLWFGHAERYSNKSTKILYGNRSARDIFYDHPRDVFFNKLPKYKRQYFIKEEG